MNTIDSESQEKCHVSPIRSVPEEWDEKTLLDAVGMKKDLIVAGPFGSNLKVSDYKNEGIPIIRLQNIDYGKFIDKEIKYISSEKARELAYHSFRAGDLVLAKLGDPIGKTCIVPGYFKDGIVVADVVRIRVEDSWADKKFIMYSLNSIATKNQLINGTIGSTRPRVNLDQIRDLRIFVPPLNEQRKIAAILSTVDAVIEQTDAIITQTERMKAGLMQVLLSEKDSTNGTLWNAVDLRTVCNHVLNGGTPSTKIEKYWVGDIPWITGADITDQKIGHIRRYITEEAVKNSSTHIVPKGNLLIVTRTGIGKLAIAPFDVAISQDITGILPNKLTTTKYLFWILNKHKLRLKKFDQGTSINGIKRDELLSLKISLPPISEQCKIASRLCAVNEKLGLDSKYRENLKLLKSGLMQDLLTGIVRVKVDGHA